MRTHEQVVADVEKRFNELKEAKRLHEEEMKLPKYTKPCETCRHFLVIKHSYSKEQFCNNPLVKGIDKPIDLSYINSPRVFRKDVEKISVCKGVTLEKYVRGSDRNPNIISVNDEQALWEPRLGFWRKVAIKFIGE